MMCNVGFSIPIPSRSELSALYSSETYRSASGKRFVGLVETAINFSRQLRRKRIDKYLDIPHHPYHFSEKGLSNLIEKYNFHEESFLETIIVLSKCAYHISPSL